MLAASRSLICVPRVLRVVAIIKVLSWTVAGDLSAGQFQEFVDVCDAINRDASAKVVILTGAGTAFCSGVAGASIRSYTGEPKRASRSW